MVPSWSRLGARKSLISQLPWATLHQHGGLVRTVTAPSMLHNVNKYEHRPNTLLMLSHIYRKDHAAYGTHRAFHSSSLRLSFSASPRLQDKKSSTSKGNEGKKSNTEEEEDDDDEPPRKASVRERLRFLTRRYGWWALTVYLLASAVDFSATFAVVHFAGAEHIRNVEERIREWVGLGKRQGSDEETAAWPVPVSTVGEESNTDTDKKDKLKQTYSWPDSTKGTATASISSSLWAEAVLAYTIHKTLLLPFRVAVTAGITPSFVKLMVRLGWSRPTAVIRKAAEKKSVVKHTKNS